jgi:hypothetical protein
MNNFQTLFSRILVLPALVCGGQLMAQSMDGSFAIDYGSILINTPQNLVSEIDSTPETIYNQTGRAATPLSLTFTPNSAYRKKNVADYVRQVAKIAPDYAPKLDADLGDAVTVTVAITPKLITP